MLPAQHGNQNLEFAMIQQKSMTLKQVQKSQYSLRGVAKVDLLRLATWPLAAARNPTLRHLSRNIAIFAASHEVHKSPNFLQNRKLASHAGPEAHFDDSSFLAKSKICFPCGREAHFDEPDRANVAPKKPHVLKTRGFVCRWVVIIYNC